MTAAGATTYQWDGANRLKSVNGGTSGSYGFDGNGKRVKKTEGGASTYYVYSSVIGSAVMEVASAGVQRAYVMNGGSVVAQRNPDGNFYWLHADHLGSGRKMTNTSGNLTYRAEFDPYGKLLYEWSATPNQNTKKFTGYERDAGSGLDYAQARMYGSEWGRFMSPDPKGIGSANRHSPLSLNRYSYAGGNPVNFIDPTGTSFWSWIRGFFGRHFEVEMVFDPMEDLNDFLGRSNDYWNEGGQLQPDLQDGGGKKGTGLPNEPAEPMLPQELSTAENNIASTARTGLQTMLGNISEDCQKNVIDKLSKEWSGFSVAKLLTGLASTAFYNALSSGNQVSSTSTLAKDEYKPGMTVSGFFGANPGVQALSTLGISPAAIYFRSGVLTANDQKSNSSLLFHEVLHGTIGIVDSDIQKFLGITVDKNNTHNITDYIKAHCFYMRLGKNL